MCSSVRVIYEGGLDTFVNAVFVHDEKLLLAFNFKDGTRTITLNDAKIAVKKNTGSNLDCSAAPKIGDPRQKVRFHLKEISLRNVILFQNHRNA